MKQFTITSNDANQRLDKFLKKLLPHAPLSFIYKLNRKNCVKVNRKRKDNEYIIQEGESVELFIKDEEYEILRVQKVSALRKSNGTTKQGLDTKDIVYEDNDLLIINKNP